MIASYGFSTTATVIAWIGAPLVLGAVILWVSGAVQGILNALGNQTPPSADANVRALTEAQTRPHSDPLGPVGQYGPVNEAREHLRRRGK